MADIDMVPPRSARPIRSRPDTRMTCTARIPRWNCRWVDVAGL